MTLATTHKQSYPAQSQVERLVALELSVSAYQRLKYAAAERAERESQIPESDVANTVSFFIEHPQVGAQKAQLSLLDQEKALISATFCNDIKHQLKDLCLAERERRRVESELENERQDRVPTPTHVPPIRATRPHEIWATDFLELSVLGYRHFVCIIYDLYSQAYLSVRVGSAPSHQLASDALADACSGTPHRPKRYLISDNGSAYLSTDFAESLARLKVKHHRIPPASPWLNGSLESNNRSLRGCIFSCGIKALSGAAAPSKAVRELSSSYSQALAAVQGYCDAACGILNDQLARQRHRTTPASALAGQVQSAVKRHQHFTAAKQRERRQRMAAIQNRRLVVADKTLADKVATETNRQLSKLSDEQLHALTELLNGRFGLLAA